MDVAPLQLETHVLTDPFVKDYALNYLGMVVGSAATLGFYTVANFGKEINNISEYRTLSDFFKSALTGVIKYNYYLLVLDICVARYWPSIFEFLWTDRKSRSIETQNRTRPIS